MVIFKTSKKNKGPVPVVCKFIGDDYSNMRDIWKKSSKFQKGTYTMMVSVDWI